MTRHTLYLFKEMQNKYVSALITLDGKHTRIDILYYMWLLLDTVSGALVTYIIINTQCISIVHLCLMRFDSILCI